MKREIGGGGQHVKLQQAAPHVIMGGDQDDGAEIFLPHPGGGFAGVADGVARGAAQADAAGFKRRAARQAGEEAGEIRVAADAGDEELAAIALLQELEAGGDAFAAAGQHDDRGPGGGLRVGRGGEQRCGFGFGDAAQAQVKEVPGEARAPEQGQQARQPDEQAQAADHGMARSTRRVAKLALRRAKSSASSGRQTASAPAPIQKTSCAGE